MTADSGLCVPRFHSTPDPDAAHELPGLAATAEACGMPLLPWVADAFRVCTERTSDGYYRFRTNVLTVPRQSGKSIAVSVLAIDRLLAEPDQYGTLTAQSRKAATSRLGGIAKLLLASRLDPDAKVTMGVGGERIRFGNGSLLEVQSPTADAQHGESIDLAIVDEAFGVSELVMGAIVPAMAARADAQLWIISTQGTLLDSTLLNGLCEQGRHDPDGTLGYVEYSIPDEVHPYSWDDYPTFHPGIGHTVHLPAIRDAATHLSLGEFTRAYGNRPTTSADEWIPDGRWSDTHAVAPIPPEVCVAVDSSTRGASVCAAYPLEDGQYHVDLVEHRPGDDPSWLPRRVALITEGRKVNALVYESQGPAGLLTPDLQSVADDYGVPLIARTRTDRSRGDMFAHELLVGDPPRLTHGQAPPLDEAAEGTAVVRTGDLWRFSRSKSVVDPSPLIAATMAVYAAHEVNVLRPVPLIGWG